LVTVQLGTDTLVQVSVVPPLVVPDAARPVGVGGVEVQFEQDPMFVQGSPEPG